MELFLNSNFTIVKLSCVNETHYDVLMERGPRTCQQESIDTGPELELLRRECVYVFRESLDRNRGTN